MVQVDMHGPTPGYPTLEEAELSRTDRVSALEVAQMDEPRSWAQWLAALTWGIAVVGLVGLLLAAGLPAVRALFSAWGG